MFEQLIGKKVRWVPVVGCEENNTEVLKIIRIEGHLAWVNPITPRPGDKRLVPFQARTSDLILIDNDDGWIGLNAISLANFINQDRDCLRGGAKLA
jgi:hypothetical protein